jgi:small subunit ribosomal protein S20
MANHQSAIKRHRQSLKNRARNNHYRRTVKTFMGKALAAAEAGSKEAPELLKKAISVVDKVVGKGILPKNRGSRLVSRLGSQLSSLKG